MTYFGQYGHHGHFGHFGHDNAWFWVLSSITMVLLWLVLIAILVLLWRMLMHRTGPAALRRGNGSALTGRGHDRGTGHDRSAAPADVLADRLARGEIDTDEYRRRMAALRGDPDPGP